MTGPILLDPVTEAAMRQVATKQGLVNLRLRCCNPLRSAGDGLARWSSPNVTYDCSALVGGLSSILGGEVVLRAYQNACESWNKVCGIKMRLSQSGGNIVSSAGRIDGSSGTLAWSYLPGVPSGMKEQLKQLFDISERWTEQWLQEVACHEVGHAIGLDHSPDKNALMYPYSHNGSLPVPQAWDIAEGVKRYGPPVAVPPGNPPPVPPGNPSVPEIGGVVTIDGVPYRMVLERIQ